MENFKLKIKNTFNGLDITKIIEAKDENHAREFFEKEKDKDNLPWELLSVSLIHKPNLHADKITNLDKEELSKRINRRSWNFFEHFRCTLKILIVLVVAYCKPLLFHQTFFGASINVLWFFWFIVFFLFVAFFIKGYLKRFSLVILALCMPLMLTRASFIGFSFASINSLWLIWFVIFFTITTIYVYTSHKAGG